MAGEHVRVQGTEYRTLRYHASPPDVVQQIIILRVDRQIRWLNNKYALNIIAERQPLSSAVIDSVRRILRLVGNFSKITTNALHCKC